MPRLYRSAPEYAVRPVIGIPKGLVMPLTVERYADRVDRNFARVQAEFYDLLGVTFELEPAFVWRSDFTEAEALTAYPDSPGGFWTGTLRELGARGWLDIHSGKRFYYFVTPIIGVAGGWVGGEWMQARSLMPGTASIPSYMGRMLGGWQSPDPTAWWADEARESMGGVMHELGHSFGAYQDLEWRWQGMPHNGSWDSDSIMLSWWMFNLGAGFTEKEKQMIAESPVGQKFLS